MRDRSLGHQEAAKKHAKVQYINKPIREVINSYGDQWGIEIHNQVRDFEFLGDKMSIYKIMGNLFANAHRQIKEKGQGEIFITTGEYENYNILKVKDTAGGVTQAFVDRILDLYKTKEVKGTGIGLSSAQVLMKDMNGRLEVHLVEGDKIEFQLFFPKIV
jgi:signal transduction histidine kinase